MLRHPTMNHHQQQQQQPSYRLADGETISISIGIGADARTASSIVLPRGHDLVKHLERLLPAMAKSVEVSYHQQQQPHHQDNHSVRGYSSPQYQSPQQQSPQQHSNYMTSSYDMHHHSHSHSQHRPQYLEHPHSPYHSDASSSNGSMQSALAASMAPQQQYTGVRRRRGPTGGQGAGKKCQFPNCEKISVSRGLCRGHGGGRRCQHAGCSKGAQSRSDFCWAHGGGQRCEVKNCMRSRKSKRFCVAHLSWEGVASPSESSSQHHDVSVPSHRVYEQPKAIMPKLLAPYIPETATSLPSPTTISIPALSMSSKLPSLQQALMKNHQQCTAPTQRHSGFPHQHAVLNSASG